jgi:diguanylate cyclase (GGDEF)-like protein
VIFSNQPSIQKKIERALLITGVGVLILATIGFAVNDYISSKKNIQERLSAQAAIIAGNSVGAVTFDDVESANKTLASLEHEPNIVAAALYKEDGARMAFYQRHPYPLPIQAPRYPEGTVGNELFVLTDIVLDGELVGSVLLVSDLKNWRKRQRGYLMTVAALFFVSLMFAVLLARGFRRLITGPILNLASTTREIADNKNYQLRAQKEGEDEVGKLVDDFNSMLQEIEKRESQLQKAQQELEHKVVERTTELASANEKLKYQAHFDRLTGLANRITFESNLKAGINRTDRRGGKLITFFLDLDRFKTVNDSLGHDIGDKLLVEVSNRLSKSLREGDTLARLGGDEFAVLLENISSEAAADVAMKLIDVVKKTIIVEGYHLKITTSVGISVYPSDGQNAADIVKHADTAMYHAKDQGRNQFSFYSSAMNKKAERRLLLENKLRRALETQSFHLNYQPKYDVNNLELMGVEALIRWNDPDEGNIPPAEFIPLAEECGMAADIDLWVMRRACQEVLSLFDGQRPAFGLSVNYCASHFVRNHASDEIAAILKETGFPGDKLEVEITETLIASSPDHLHEQLSAIHALGVELSIDDFGKAYSSLSRLKELPLNTLKIDGSFIRDIGVDKDDEVIVKTIITMGKNLNLKVVAEGVENDIQYQFIKAEGADLVQGFLFSRPVSLERLREIFCDNQGSIGTDGTALSISTMTKS